MDYSLSEEIRKYPFVKLCLVFIFGILVSIYFSIPSFISNILFLLSLLLFLILNFKKNFSTGFITSILINLVLFTFGLFITQNKIELFENDNLNIKNSLIIGQIIKDTRKADKTVIIDLEINAINHSGTWNSSSGKLLLYLESDSLSKRLKVGDIILFNSELSEVKNKGNPEEFDYKKYLSYNLIYNSDYLSAKDWCLLESNYNLNIKHKILRFRTKLIDILRDFGLNKDELAVASALALGYKDNLSNELKHSYSSSGAMHILAVSGLHVGIVYGVLLYILSFVRSKKYNLLKVLITIFFIWFYALLTGMSPSVSRAALMFSIAAVGSINKYKSGALNAIALSAFILLIINPLNITDIGFQLSYLAVLGIVIIQPYIYAIFCFKNKLLDKVWLLTTVSISAQIATAPICIYYFNQFSNYFLLTNYILIPVSTIAIWICIVIFIFSGISFIGLFFSKILAYVIKFMNYSTEFIESMPYSVSEKLHINVLQVFILYAFIIFIFIFIFLSKKYKHLMFSAILLIVFLCINLYDVFTIQKQKYLVVYNIDRVSAINVIDGRDNIVFANLDLNNIDKIRFTAKKNWLKKGLDEEKYIELSSNNKNLLSMVTTIDNKRVFYKNKFIGFENYKIFVLDKEFNSVENNNKKVDVDFIVLSNNPKVRLSDIDREFNFKTIIIDSSNNNFKIDDWINENVENNYCIHNVKTDGAFVFKI